MAMRFVLLAALMLMLGGCSLYLLQSNGFHRALEQRQPERALEILENQSHRSRDRVLTALNKGALLSMLGRYADSNQQFESIKADIERLSAASITENLASVAINETLRSYEARPFDVLLLHAYMMMNYLTMAQWNEARVEALQADVRLKKMDGDELSRTADAAAFVRYLSGIVFELNSEWDAALVAYRQAYKIYNDTIGSVPIALKKELLRLTKQHGLQREYKQYHKAFGLDYAESNNKSIGQGELVLVVQQGLAPRLHEHLIYAHSYEVNRDILVALPFYPMAISGPYVDQRLNVIVADETYEATLFANIEKLAYDDLESRIAAITTRALARAVVKEKMVANTRKKEGEFWGAVIDIVGEVTERADTRSWTSLPNGFYLARIHLPEGEYKIRVAGEAERVVSVVAGETKFLSMHTIPVAYQYELRRH